MSGMVTLPIKYGRCEVQLGHSFKNFKQDLCINIS